MRLIPEDHKIPILYSTEDETNPLCHIKLFTPDANWTWYIIEIDEAQELCFGYVVGLEQELGYFTMGEITSLRGALNLPVERDLAFQPTALEEIKRLHHAY